MMKRKLKFLEKSVFIGLAMFFALATSLAQPESIVLENDHSTPIDPLSIETNSSATFISESYQIPAYELYNKSWSTEFISQENLQIPFSNQQLKIVLTQPNSPFYFPCQGTILQSFSNKAKKQHWGIDIQTNANDPVVACFDGVVRLVREFDQYGNVIIIRHYNGLETIYGHLGKVDVKPGQRIQAGELIGTCPAYHDDDEYLHFETRFFNQPFNPQLFIDKETHRLLSDTLVLTPQDMVETSTTQSVATNSSTSNTSATTSAANIHVVKEGDTLYKISRQYNISVEKILQLNHLKENSILSLGQKIRIR